MSNYILKEELFYGKERPDFKEFNNFVICSDKNVVRSMGVLIYSLIKNSRRKNAFHIFFNGEMPEDDKKRFKFLSEKYSVVINIYYVNNEYFKNFNSTSSITETAYYRIIAPKILMSKFVDKFIYLDTDMLCLNELDALYKIDISDKIAFVVKDYGFTLRKNKDYWKRLGLTSNKYFNSGFLLINVENYVNNKIEEKAIDLLKNSSYPYMDQDVLNVLLDGKIIIDEEFKYNCMTSVPDEYNNDDVAIVHFTGTRKPWKQHTSLWGENTPPFSSAKRQLFYKIWRDYWLKSPWKDIPLDEPKNNTEWRYLAEMYFSNNKFIHGIKAYYKYLKLKF